jgi:hypothetical protein
MFFTPFLFQPFRNQAGTMIWFWKLSLLIEQIIFSASSRFEFRAQSLSSNEHPESLSVVYVQFKNGYVVEYWLALLLSTGYTRVKGWHEGTVFFFMFDTVGPLQS